MILSALQKVILNLSTVITWFISIVVIVYILSKHKEIKTEAGISVKTYLALVAIAEIFYIIGAVMILSAIGVNVTRYLSELEIGRCAKIVSQFDIGTANVIGVVGWVGFAINRSFSFLAPGYLLVSGGRSLPRVIYLSVWAEVGLEALTSALIAVSLVAG